MSGEKINRNFLAGKMNTDLDERLVPNGEYREALNLRLSSSDGPNAGALENVRGNTALSSLSLTNATTLGVYVDEGNSILYWFVTSDEKDLVMEYDENSGTSNIILESSNPGGVLGFDSEFTITGVIKIYNEDPSKDLLIWTDNNMPPRCINIKRAREYGADNFDKYDINLIKRPPAEAPEVLPTNTSSTLENNMSDKFLLFSYRYKYLDGEYSALSPSSNFAFTPDQFDLDGQTLKNNGMKNIFNAVKIDFETGDNTVTDIQLFFRESQFDTIYRIENFNKKDKGWSDDETKSFTFSNNKNYAALPEDELYRTYDNVPIKAKALELMVNRLVFGNYVEGFNMKTLAGNDVVTKFEPSILSNDLNEETTEFALSTTTNADDTATLEFFDINFFSVAVFPLTKGSLLGFRIDLADSTDTYSFNGSFTYILEEDFNDASELAASENFINFVEDSWTTIFDSENDSVAPGGSVQDGLVNFSILSSSDVRINIKAPEITYDIAPNLTWKYISTSELYYRQAGVLSSVKTNRDYELGIIYEEDYGRKSTVQTSETNTVYVPQTLSTSKNRLYVNVYNKPPAWATRYRFAIKQSRTDYETLYATIFYRDGAYYWVKLEGDSASKVSVGDILIPKSDINNTIDDVIEIEVLELKTQESDFIVDNAYENGENIIEDAGLYMKIKPTGMNMQVDSPTLFSYSETETGGGLLSGRQSVTLGSRDSMVGYFNTTTSLYVDYPIPAGSTIKMKFVNWERESSISPKETNTYLKTFKVQSTHANFQTWYEQEVIDLGSQEVNFNVSWTRGSENQLRMSIQGEAETSNPFGTVEMSADVDVNLTGSAVIFETKPKFSNDEVFYEVPGTFYIENGYHLGNTQSQTETVTTAVCELDFFNCFVQGNGAESYKYTDSFLGNKMGIDVRPTIASLEEFKEVRRISDLTYSGVYNESTNLNGLNEFNLSQANFKDDIDKKYGSIQRLHSRDTDLMVIQEDNWSRVLFGKSLLMNADGTANVSSIQDVLGQQVPIAGEFGISTNPESFVVEGNDIYATDKIRGTVLRYSADGLSEINYGMSTWFRELLKVPYDVKIRGGFDPFTSQYLLHIDSNTELKDRVLDINDDYSLSNFTGTFTLTYNLPISAGSIKYDYDSFGKPVRYQITQGATSIDTGFVTTPNTYYIPKLEGSGQTMTVTITAQECDTTISTNSLLSLGDRDIRLLVINDAGDIGKTVVVGWKWIKDGYEGGGREEIIKLVDDNVEQFQFEYTTTGLPPEEGAGEGIWTVNGAQLEVFIYPAVGQSDAFDPLNNTLGVSVDLADEVPHKVLSLQDTSATIVTGSLPDGRLIYSALYTVGTEHYHSYVFDLRNVYSSAEIYEVIQKDDCGPGQVGSYTPYTLAAGYATDVTQAAADATAQAYFDSTKQAYANDEGACSLIPPGGSTLFVTASVPLVEAGTLDIYGGEPNEVLSFDLVFLYNSSRGVFKLTSPATDIAICDALHTTRSGDITLDSSGQISIPYELSDSCKVTMTLTNRSSAEPDPDNLDTIIDNNY